MTVRRTQSTPSTRIYLCNAQYDSVSARVAPNRALHIIIHQPPSAATAADTILNVLLAPVSSFFSSPLSIPIFDNEKKIDVDSTAGLNEVWPHTAS